MERKRELSRRLIRAEMAIENSTPTTTFPSREKKKRRRLTISSITFCEALHVHLCSSPPHPEGNKYKSIEILHSSSSQGAAAKQKERERNKIPKIYMAFPITFVSLEEFCRFFPTLLPFIIHLKLPAEIYH